MAMLNSHWWWWQGSGNGYHTIDVNLAPAWMTGEVQLYGTSGGGTQYAGVKSYRQRLSNGSDLNHDFGDWPSWPPLIYDYISSFTFGIATGSDQDAWAQARVDWWG